MFLIGVFQQLNGRIKGDKLIQNSHVDAVTIGIADLRGRRNHDDFLRVKAIQYFQNTIFQGRSTNYRIVDDDQRINVVADYPVGDIVNVGNQVVATGIVGNEGPQFHIFNG